jgi:hypothetical protein
MSGPQDAVTDANGFRIYKWVPAPESIPWLREHNLPTDPINVMSVTSIRRACGEGFALVNWQIANVLDVATGMEKAVVVGPRGGVSEKRISTDWPPPFIAQLMATNGDEAALMKLRAKWRTQADQPRDRAAVRGTIVHSFIEHNVTEDRIDEDFVTNARDGLDARDRQKMGVVTPQDVKFINRCVWQYWYMRRVRPFVILAREPQVWNLSIGYSGSADALFWFLPVGTPESEVVEWQRRADAGEITMEMIESTGGDVVLGDWKTSKDVHTDHVLQVTAYMSAEYIASKGVIDERLTEMIRDVRRAAIVNIRPNGTGIYFLNWREDALLGFIGSVQMARFLVTFPDPQPLFTESWHGNAAEEVAS